MADASLGHKVYFAGGGICNIGWHDHSNIIDIDNDGTDTWSVKYLFEPRIGHSIASMSIEGEENLNTYCRWGYLAETA